MFSLSRPTLQAVARGIARRSLATKKPTETPPKKKRPEWMVEAEREAIAATQARAEKLTPMAKYVEKEAPAEVEKPEEKLAILIRALDTARERVSASPPASRAAAVTSFNAMRKRAMTARQEVITQRETAGLARDLNNVIETEFPIGEAMVPHRKRM